MASAISQLRSNQLRLQPLPTSQHRPRPHAAHPCGAPRSSTRTSPILQASRDESAGHQSSPKPDRPIQQTRPLRSVNASPDSSRRSRLRLRSRPQTASNSWCTGKDSNLRTSQGGTDLQSVGFNHSPTCAKMPSLPAPITQVSIRPGFCVRAPILQAGNDPIEKQSARENPLARKHHTWKNSLWSAVGKNLLRRRAAQSPIFRNRSCDSNQSNAGAGEGI